MTPHCVFYCLNGQWIKTLDQCGGNCQPPAGGCTNEGASISVTCDD